MLHIWSDYYIHVNEGSVVSVRNCYNFYLVSFFINDLLMDNSYTFHLRYTVYIILLLPIPLLP